MIITQFPNTNWKEQPVQCHDSLTAQTKQFFTKLSGTEMHKFQHDTTIALIIWHKKWNRN